LFFQIGVLDSALDKCFKNYSNTELAKKSVILGVITSVFLVVLKLIAWFITDSISMRASMNDSILDALTSFLAYHAIRFSSVSFDKGHNYGHEKVEGLMALFQSLLVIYSVAMIFVEAYEAFVDPKPILNSRVGIIVMIISCCAVYQLVYFQKYVAQKAGSAIVKGDCLHYLSDFLVNICIITSLMVATYFPYIDLLCGTTVGCYVLYSAYLILKSAIMDLMDEALSEEIQVKIRDKIKSVDGVEEIKILKTRSAGMKKYVESRVAVNGTVALIQADMIAQAIENEVREMFENVDVIIKAEPC
jgi:ferrous-iron efflux pump FieF